MPLPPGKERYTYQDYLTCPEGERWELIDGIPFDMNYGYPTRHQRVLGKIAVKLFKPFKEIDCEAVIGPLDIVLTEYDVVEPDFIVVCDEKKITETHIQGAPDLIVEVISPISAERDRGIKKDLYERNGVREYILADPYENHVTQFFLNEEGQYNQGEILNANDVLTVKILPSVKIDLSEIFKKEEWEQNQ